MKAVIRIITLSSFVSILALPAAFAKDAQETSASAELAQANAAIEGQFAGAPKVDTQAVAGAAEAQAEAQAALEAPAKGAETAVAAVPAPAEAAQAAEEKAAAIVGEATDIAAEQAKIAGNPAWESMVPDVKVSKWGSELKIVVTPSSLMEEEQKLAIQSVKLETVKGEFLGLKTYNADEKDRTAEFMINPELLKIDAVKLTAVSSKDGEWAKVVSLAVEDPTKTAETEYTGQAPAGEAPAAAPAEEAKKEEKGKKKKGWW